MTETHGWTAKGFEALRDIFQANFDNGSEVGAAFSAYHKGQKVADLWGGVADQETGREWEEDSIILVFSSTKGMTAVCANKLAQEGLLDVDAPVVEYWPEFGQAGKETIPVSYLLSHQAGLAWVDAPMTADEMFAWSPVIEAIEKQAPSWEPGTQHGYHATMYGWLVGELIRRVAGKSVGTYLHDEIAAPLDLSLWIGLPESEEPRVASLISMFPPGMSFKTLETPGEDDPVAQLMAQFIGPDTMLGKALTAPGGALTDLDMLNTRPVRAAELPAFNGVCDARSLARLYASCINEVDGVRIIGPEQLEKATEQHTQGPNTILMGFDLQFGLGFMLHSDLVALGGKKSFGHFGMGGSVGWADPDAELAFGYVMNRMDIGLTGDLRSFNLINACYEAIK